MVRRVLVNGLLVFVAAVAAIGVVGPVSAPAHVPAGPPVFSHPLDITNPFQPFKPGAVKVFNGRRDGKASVIVDIYLDATRTFSLNGVSVACRVLQETEFEDGQLIEVSRNFFAQADDGTVYYFGELVNTYDVHGAIVGHEGSWLVGGPTDPTDPADTANAKTPGLFMPGRPEVGDVFKPEDLFPVVDETVTVKRLRQNLSVPAGKFELVLQVEETSQLGDTPETKWYAPGVGVVKGHTKGESFSLIATTLRP